MYILNTISKLHFIYGCDRNIVFFVVAFAIERYNGTMNNNCFLCVTLRKFATFFVCAYTTAQTMILEN